MPTLKELYADLQKDAGLDQAINTPQPASPATQTDLGQYSLPFVPSVGIPTGEALNNPNAPQQFATEPLDRRQAIALRGARREVGRAQQQFAGTPLAGDLRQGMEEGVDEFGFDDILTPLFDFLSAGNYASAGFFDELIETGRVDEAFKQAAIEFASSMPMDSIFAAFGTDIDALARKRTFADVLKRADIFDESTGGRTAAAGLGFLLDIIADPLVFTPLGAVKLAGAIGRPGLARAGQAVGSLGFSEASRIIKRSGGSLALASKLEDANIPLVSRFGESFIPDFQLRRFAREGDEEAAEAVQRYLELRTGNQAHLEDAMLSMQEQVAMIRSKLTEDESRLMTLFLQEEGDTALRSALADKLRVRGNVSDERMQELFDPEDGAVAQFRKLFKEWGEVEKKAGLLSEEAILVNYIAQRAPQTRRSMRAWRNMTRDMGIEEMTPEKAQRLLGESFMGETPEAYQLKRVYDTVIERVQAGVPTEMDMGLSTLSRGFEHVRSMTTRRFADAFLSDPAIVRRIEDPGLLGDMKALDEFAGNGFIPFNLKTMKPLSLGQIKQAKGKELQELVDGGIVMAPRPMVADLTKAEKLVGDPSTARRFWDGFQQVQGVWKGYALLSPAYHTRNHFSNIFNNWLGGVAHPGDYARAMAIQAGGTENLPRVVRAGVEAIIGRKSLDDVFFTTKEGVDMTGHMIAQTSHDLGVTGKGVFAQEMAGVMERDLLTTFEKGLKQARLDAPSPLVRKAAISLRVQAEDAGADFGEGYWANVESLINARAVTWAVANGQTSDAYIRKVFNPTLIDGDVTWHLLDPDNVQPNQFAQIAPGLQTEAHPNVIKQAGVSTNTNTGKSVAENLDRVDAARAAVPDPASSPEAWNEFTTILTGGKNGIKPPPLVLEAQRNSDIVDNMIRKESMTTSQLRDVDNGVIQSDRIGLAHAKGEVTERQVAASVAWSLLSIRRSAFAHETAFVDTMALGLDDFIDEALVGKFDEKKFADWIYENRNKVAPGTRSATSTLADNVSKFMRTLGQPIKSGPYKDRKFAEVMLELYRRGNLHRIGADSYTNANGKVLTALSAKEVRREMFKIGTWTEDIQGGYTVRLNRTKAKENVLDEAGEVVRNDKGKPVKQDVLDEEGNPVYNEAGVTEKGSTGRKVGMGMQAKIASFNMLGNGLDDVMVLDAWQTRNLWGGVDPAVSSQLYDIGDVYQNGNLAEALQGPRGLALFEAIEDAMRPIVKESYERIRPETKGSLGRFHWETWDSALGASVNHRTLAIFSQLKDHSGIEAIQGLGAFQGAFLGKAGRAELDKYEGMYRFSATYLDKTRWNLYSTVETGEIYKFNDKQMKSFSDALKKLVEKSQRGTGKGGIFKTDKGADVPFDQAIHSGDAVTPIRNSPFIDKKQFDELVEKHAESKLSNEEYGILQKAATETGYDATDKGIREVFEQRDVSPLIKADALQQKYDVVFASNVLNTQGSEEMLDATLMQMADAIDDGGRMVFNLPSSPRKGAYAGMKTGEANRFLEAKLESLFGAVRKVSKSGDPVWVVSTPRAEAMEALRERTRGFEFPAGDVEVANKTARAAGAVGARAVTPRWIQESGEVAKDARILDFGSGFAAQHSHALKDAGFTNVTAHEFGANAAFGDDLKQVMRGEGTVRGMIGFDAENRAIIRLMESANASTAIHELGHLIRRDLAPEDLAIIEKNFSVRNGQWSKDSEERFARALEEYVRQDKAPAKALERPFAMLAEGIDSVYRAMGRSKVPVRINNNIRQVFDQAFGKDVLLPDDQVAMARAAINADPDPHTWQDKARRVGGAIDDKAGRSSPLLALNRRIGTAVENNAHLTHWIGRMRHGDDAKQAAASTKKYLFDYNDLTDFERDVMRNIIPFYTWMRKNTPLQIQAILEDPQRYAKIPKMINAMESVTDDWQGIDTPDYFQQLQAVRLPLLLGSKPIYFDHKLPFQDLNRLNWKDIASSMSPVFKVLAELGPGAGTNLFSGSKIERFQDEPGDVLPGVSRKTEHAITSFMPPVGRALSALKAAGVGDVEKEDLDSESLALNLLNQTLGVKLNAVDVRRVQRGQTYAARELARALKRRLEKEGSSLSEERKKK